MNDTEGLHRQTVAVAHRLVADAMLGRLARWLRALGYDVLYDARTDDAGLSRIARAEGRVLLTRDWELAARRGIRTVLVHSEHLSEQLGQVVAALPPVRGLEFSRCVACNGLLYELDFASVEGHVPEYIWERGHSFRRCSACGRIFWPGSHQARMSERLGLSGDRRGSRATE